MQTDCFPDAVEDWEKQPIGQHAVVNPRYKVVRGRDYPFVEMAVVAENFGGIQEVGSRKAEGSGLSRFKVGDTLFAKITPCPENGKVAYVAELPDELGIGSTEFIVLSPKGGCDPRFLYHLVCSYDVRGRAIARMEGSTGRQRVPEDAFRKRLVVPVPPLEEQESIVHMLDSVDTCIERTQLAIDRARDMRRALRESLMSRGIGANGLVREWSGSDFVSFRSGRFPEAWRPRLGRAGWGRLDRCRVPCSDLPTTPRAWSARPASGHPWMCSSRA